MTPKSFSFADLAGAVLCSLVSLTACRAHHPPFPDVPDEAVPAPPPIFERRTEYYDKAATQKRREWHVWVYEGGVTLRDGEELEWWPGGGMRARRRFERGEPTAEWTTWFENGTKSSECTLGSDELSPMRWWHPNGVLASEGPGRNGSREGRWRTWHENGAPESEGEYRDNRREGPWTFWNDDGGLCESRVYRAGVAVDVR
ncbi:MAG: hypothetical protein HZA52_04475 [Planctomycetes bacterium]|nr:hypothetical protein [Planctomycetota bacterium]